MLDAGYQALENEATTSALTDDLRASAVPWWQNMDDDHHHLAHYVDLSDAPAYSMDTKVTEPLGMGMMGTMVEKPPIKGYGSFFFELALAPNLEQFEVNHPRVPIALDRPTTTVADSRTTSDFSI